MFGCSEICAANGKESEFVTFVRSTTGLVKTRGEGDEGLASQVPVFMGHGADDAYVNVELGREAMQLLPRTGFRVRWKEYSGAEQEGHWLKVPEEMDDIYEFLSGLTK